MTLPEILAQTVTTLKEACYEDGTPVLQYAQAGGYVKCEEGEKLPYATVECHEVFEGRSVLNITLVIGMRSGLQIEEQLARVFQAIAPLFGGLCNIARFGDMQVQGVLYRVCLLEVEY